MKDKPSENIYETIISSWQIWLAFGSAFVYLIGYFRALLFFRTLDILVTPTEVYTNSSLFVWGLTTIISALMLPIIIGIITLAISRLPALRKLKSWIFYGCVFLAIGISLFLLLPIVAEHNPLGLFILPSLLALTVFPVTHVILVLTLLPIALIVFFWSRLKNRKQMIAGFLLVAWIFAVVWAQKYDFVFVNMGVNPTVFSQSPAMAGYIATRSGISPVSEQAPEFGNDAYRTVGILLSHHDGKYYFLPGFQATEGNPNFPYLDQLYTQIVIIPESNVIVFMAIRGERGDFPTVK